MQTHNNLARYHMRQGVHSWLMGVIQKGVGGGPFHNKRPFAELLTGASAVSFLELGALKGMKFNGRIPLLFEKMVNGGSWFDSSHSHRTKNYKSYVG